MRRALIVLLAAFTAGDAVYLVLRSPFEALDRIFVGAVVLALLLPAAVALVGLRRDSMPLVAAAGALCALPAVMAGLPVISFAGFLAIAGLGRGPMPSARERLRGIAVMIVGTAAWIVPYLGWESSWDYTRTFDPWRLGVTIAVVIGSIALAIGRLGRPAASVPAR